MKTKKGSHSRVLWISFVMVLALCLMPGCLHAEKGDRHGAANASIEITDFMGVYGGDSFLVFGKARNAGESPVEKAVLAVEFLDSGRNLVARQAVSSPGEIAVNGTWDFEVFLEGPSAQAVRFYEITALCQ